VSFASLMRLWNAADGQTQAAPVQSLTNLFDRISEVRAAPM
jgi:hypothetical protein